jgi:hypothetical protein
MRTGISDKAIGRHRAVSNAVESADDESIGRNNNTIADCLATAYVYVFFFLLLRAAVCGVCASSRRVSIICCYFEPSRAAAEEFRVK